jgi:hypothetical protein
MFPGLRTGNSGYLAMRDMGHPLSWFHLALIVYSALNLPQASRLIEMTNWWKNSRFFMFCSQLPNKFVIPTGEMMALRPIQGDEKLQSGNDSFWKRRPPLCHLDRSVAEWRDLCVDASSWECFRGTFKPLFQS